MSDREEVLQQISEIKSHLLDRETFFPYNYNACYIWAFIAMILTFIMVPVFQSNTLFGTIFVSVLMAVGFIVESVLIKKINLDYDIEAYTKRQLFIKTNFLMITLFLIVLSAIFAKSGLYAVIYLSWLFVVSLGYYAIGFILNIARFRKMALFNMISAISLLAIGAYFNLLSSSDSLFITFIQAVLFFGLSVLPAWIAWHQKKVESSV